eukprot:1147047-Pelagomonas_calceolata.AAC.2
MRTCDVGKSGSSEGGCVWRERTGVHSQSLERDEACWRHHSMAQATQEACDMIGCSMASVGVIGWPFPSCTRPNGKRKSFFFSLQRGMAHAIQEACNIIGCSVAWHKQHTRHAVQEACNTGGMQYRRHCLPTSLPKLQVLTTGIAQCLCCVMNYELRCAAPAGALLHLSQGVHLFTAEVFFAGAGHDRQRFVPCLNIIVVLLIPLSLLCVNAHNKSPAGTGLGRCVLPSFSGPCISCNVTS